MGFSNFGHFKAPIKRPKCNPIIKDERFRRLNNLVNEGNQSDPTDFQRMIPCDSQELNHPKYGRGSNCLQSFDLENNYMYAF
jgi:hypothetical protein